MMGELEAIERASEDELRALQLQRLRWSVRHAHENVPLYRGKCQGAGDRPDIIMVTPSYMLSIVEEFLRQGLDPAATSLHTGIFGAEPWTEALRGQIESRAGLQALDIYGLSEVMGPAVASECIESKDGPVIWEDHFYPEIVDPASGEVRPAGAPGELVLTSLTKEA